MTTSDQRPSPDHPGRRRRRTPLVLRRRRAHLEGHRGGNERRVPVVRGQHGAREGDAAAHAPGLRRNDDRPRWRDPHAHGRHRPPDRRPAGSPWRRGVCRTRFSWCRRRHGCCACTHRAAARRSTGTPASRLLAAGRTPRQWTSPGSCPPRTATAASSSSDRHRSTRTDEPTPAARTWTGLGILTHNLVKIAAAPSA